MANFCITLIKKAFFSYQLISVIYCFLFLQMHSSNLIEFYRSLPLPVVPKGFEILHPQLSPEVMRVVRKFFIKYYSDNRTRKLLLGINPGRHGAGMTGINFTAPRQLTNNCEIDHPWGNSSELSAEFIYAMIDQYGGSEKFYSNFFIGAVSPLGYIKDGKNINYYDDKNLQKAVTPFIIETIQKQLSMGLSSEVCFCIGGEKNYKFLTALNDKHKLFQKIIPLAHPRFIMQYRRKKMDKYIHQYLDALHTC